MGDHRGLFEDVVIARFDCGTEGRGDGIAGHGGVAALDGVTERVAGEVLATHDLDDAAVVGVVVVEGVLVGDPEADKQRDGHAGGETRDIYKRVAFVLCQVTPGNV